MALPFFRNLGRSKRAQKSQSAQLVHSSAQQGFLGKLKKYQKAKSEHKQVMDTNQKAIERGIERIPNSERFWIPQLTSKEVTNEILARDKRNNATTNLMAARRIRKGALEELYAARAEEILAGAKKGKVVVLEAIPEKGQLKGATYQGKYIATDLQKGQIILETANSRPIKLDIGQLKRRVK